MPRLWLLPCSHAASTKEWSGPWQEVESATGFGKVVLPLWADMEVLHMQKDTHWHCLHWALDG